MVYAICCSVIEISNISQQLQVIHLNHCFLRLRVNAWLTWFYNYIKFGHILRKSFQSFPWLVIYRFVLLLVAGTLCSLLVGLHCWCVPWATSGHGWESEAVQNPVQFNKNCDRKSQGEMKRSKWPGPDLNQQCCGFAHCRSRRDDIRAPPSPPAVWHFQLLNSRNSNCQGPSGLRRSDQ